MEQNTKINDPKLQLKLQLNWTIDHLETLMQTGYRFGTLSAAFGKLSRSDKYVADLINPILDDALIRLKKLRDRTLREDS